MSERFDGASLASGLAVVAMGALLLLDEAGALELSAGLVGALVSAVVGVILIAGGLGEGRNGG